MKNLLKKSLLVLVAGLALGSCGDKPTEQPSEQPSEQPTTEQPSQSVEQPTDVAPEQGISLEDYKQYVQYDLAAVLAGLGDELSPELQAKVDAQFDAGLAAIDAATTISAAQQAFADAKAAIANEIPLANGVYSYIGLSNAEKTEILGLLEAYAVRNGITGVSLFENGGYVMYNDRITLGTETYIPGYGFGTLAEGSIKSPLTTEPNVAWQNYYHTINASDPGTANYLDDQGSEIADFYG